MVKRRSKCLDEFGGRPSIEGSQCSSLSALVSFVLWHVVVHILFALRLWCSGIRPVTSHSDASPRQAAIHGFPVLCAFAAGRPQRIRLSLSLSLRLFEPPTSIGTEGWRLERASWKCLRHPKTVLDQRPEKQQKLPKPEKRARSNICSICINMQCARLHHKRDMLKLH